MTFAQNTYLLDAGNTHVKLCEVNNGQLSKIKRFVMSEFPWADIDSNIPIVVSSVLEQEWRVQLEAFFSKVNYIHSGLKLPFKMAYHTPETLGIDRLCNMAGVANKEPQQPKLVIDLGTCIKFDFLDEEQRYQGGSISPGLSMRAKALHSFTAKLPLIPINKNAKLIGSSTKESIESGVFMGWKAEIKQFIETYQQLYPSIVVYITGGDARHFDFDQKSNIFALEHLTLEGILEIYRLNEDSI